MNKTFRSIDNIQCVQHSGLYVCSAYHSTVGIFNRTLRLALKGLIISRLIIKNLLLSDHDFIFVQE
jgi:hypothetical protein